ncbi:MAG: SDR family oxidoreductase [Rhizorhabdus sp.]|nr:MAG: SDR family oxidoreductase [Rhizorhabdus sp.]
MTLPAPSPAGRRRFEGQVAIVTGGGRGLGHAISHGFAAEGARVALVGRNPNTLAATADAIEAAGGEARSFPCDVADEDGVARLCREIEDGYGHIDVLVNNAGINPWYRRPEDTPLEEWRQIIDINLTGVFLMCKHAGRAMLARGRGAIVNISSIAGRAALAKTTAYCAAKGGVELLTKSLALDWATRGVRVNAVSPGYFETDLTEGLQNHEALRTRIAARTPMGRFGTPQEVVGACLFLASSEASYVTGQSLGVDGGWTAA